MNTTHPSSIAGSSQCSKILRELMRRRGAWVEMPTLSRISGSLNVHSRKSDLVKRGYKIEHKNVHKKGKVHSFYRLATQD